jgi:hypothetical protein
MSDDHLQFLMNAFSEKTDSASASPAITVASLHKALMTHGFAKDKDDRSMAEKMIQCFAKEGETALNEKDFKEIFDLCDIEINEQTGHIVF